MNEFRALIRSARRYENTSMISLIAGLALFVVKMTDDQPGPDLVGFACYLLIGVGLALHLRAKAARKSAKRIMDEHLHGLGDRSGGVE